MESDTIADLDADGCADALAASQAHLVDAELAQVRLVAHWCDLHSGPAAGDHLAGEGSPGRRLPGAERSVRHGGKGTPRVQEFAAGELGLLLGTTTTSARRLMADVLDMRHRHPRLWEAVASRRVRFFQARHVVRATRAAGLSARRARNVDARVTPYLGQVPWGRMQALVEAAVIAADPEAAEQRCVAAELDRFVRTGRCTEYGLKTVYARARSGDVIFFYAMCDRVAQILRLRGSLEVAGLTLADSGIHPADAADVEMDVLRSLAIGVLATPARALALLAWAESHHPGADGDEPADTQDPLPAVSATVPATALLPRATLYVHLSEESFRRQSRDPARVEGVGPVTVEQATDLLRHCQVTIRPVIDLNDDPSADGYEVHGRVREVVELRHPIEVFPHGTLSSRRADKDHRVPYLPPGRGGPPGQTTPGNLGPLARYHHRLKTFGGWRYLQPTPGVYLWRSPHGHWARVDPTGSHYLGRDPDTAALLSLRR